MWENTTIRCGCYGGILGGGSDAGYLGCWMSWRIHWMLDVMEDILDVVCDRGYVDVECDILNVVMMGNILYVSL